MASHCLLVAATGFGILVPSAAAAETAASDKTLSPYFAVKGDSAQLPLDETHADIDVAGVIARVRVTQVYRNTGGKPIEAVYVFPGSTRAAVFALRMKMGARTLEAQIQRRAEAKRLYDE